MSDTVVIGVQSDKYIILQNYINNLYYKEYIMIVSHHGNETMNTYTYARINAMRRNH